MTQKQAKQMLRKKRYMIPDVVGLMFAIQQQNWSVSHVVMFLA